MPSLTKTRNQVPLGFAMMFIAVFCFACMDTTAKWLVLAAVPALQVSFLRYFVHLLWVLVLYVPSKGASIAHSKKPWLQMLRGALLLTGTVLNFAALEYLPLTTTISIFFASPMVVCLLSIPILKEKVGIKRFTAVAMGFVGVLFVVQPWSASFDVHVFLSLGALLGASGYFVMSRLIAGVDDNAVCQFYAAGLASVLLAPWVISLWVWPANGLEWFLLVLLGSLGMLGHSLLTSAHKMAEASVLAPTVYSQIIYVSLFSWLIFDFVPTATTWFGIVIIVSSGIYIWQRERTRK